MKRGTKLIAGLVGVPIIATLAYVAGWLSGQTGQALNPVSEVQAAGGKITGPNVEAPERYAYYPGTETLAKDEVRVVACGTGMPDQRIAQASACFLFEFGNGKKMIFDLGTGAMRNIASLMIPYEYLDKIFISHLHTDHWGGIRRDVGRRLDVGAPWAPTCVGPKRANPGNGHSLCRRAFPEGV